VVMKTNINHPCHKRYSNSRPQRSFRVKAAQHGDDCVWRDRNEREQLKGERNKQRIIT